MIQNLAANVETTKKAKEKKNMKAEMLVFETKMVGGEVKWLCDKCDYTGRSNIAVKMHWTRKHRREAEEDEAKRKGEKIEPEYEKKRTKESGESEDEKEYYNDNIMLNFDEDGNMIEKSVTVKTPVERETVEMETTEPLPRTEESYKMMEYELALLRGEVASLKEVMAVKQDMVNLANGTVAGMKIKNTEQAKEIVRMKITITKFMNGNSKPDESKTKKELKEANTQLEDAMKTIRDETNALGGQGQTL